MSLPELKRKIRKLKQFEKTIRIQNDMNTDVPFVWDKFFDQRDTSGGKAAGNNAIYSLSDLVIMDKDGYKKVVDDFFARLYYEVYIHNGIITAAIYDPELLVKLGLSPVADAAAVKKKFRELAKKYHPDTGGDHEKFIDLMNTYIMLQETE